MIICVGGAVLDRKYRARAPIVAATSNPADGFRSFGGVGRNICENLARLGAETGFVSVVGDDENGRAIIDHLKRAGADTRHVGFSGRFPTAEYVAVLEPTNDLALGVADMSIFEELGPLALAPALAQAKAGDWVLFDCNLPQETIEWLAGERGKAGFRLACDTVSTIKAVRIRKALGAIDLLFTNSDEARAALGEARERGDSDVAMSLRDAGAASVILTQGASGLLVADAGGVRRIPAYDARPVDVTGAGDALVAGTLHALSNGMDIDAAARRGALLAALTIESRHSVLPEISEDFLSAPHARMRVSKTFDDQEQG